ncbi:MAG: ribonuclease HI [Gammaproteobacteria bacterium]|nr:ribonuclease HI [Gammaproteobacteria bacterium]
MTEIEIYTDGACRGNPGPGGWGALLLCEGQEHELYGAEKNTTNNRMELLAAIEGLTALKRQSQVTVFTDSKYVLTGITEWIINWRKKNWTTASKKPVKNTDLWQRLDKIVSQHDVSWQWVKGHSGDPGNDRADALANKGIDEMKVSECG